MKTEAKASFGTLEAARKFLNESDGVWTVIHSMSRYYAENTASPFIRTWESIVLTKGYKIPKIESL
jgi:hypothetical protein